MEKLKNILEIISKLSTFGIFIIAFIGYFYTVRPKYELDNLKLSMEEIKKEKLNLEKQIFTYNEQLLSIKNEKETLSNSIVDLKNEKNSLKLSLEQFVQNYENDKLVMNNKMIEYNNLIEKKEKYIKKFNLNLFVTYLFNGVDTFNESENDYIKVAFSDIGERLNNNDEPKLLVVSEKDNFLLDKYAPYNELIKKFNDFNYVKGMMFSENEFNEMKKFFLNNTIKHKKNLVFNNEDSKKFIVKLNEDRQELLNERNLLKKKINELKTKKLSPMDYFNEENKIAKEIYSVDMKIIRNSSTYYSFKNEKYQEIRNIIKTFVNKFVL